jgi:phosphoglycerate dehydrogenase-like enzyme
MFHRRQSGRRTWLQVVHTGYSSAPTIELTWALILAGARHLVDENASLRGGGWQRSIGEDLGGRTLGLLGLGNIGSAVAQIGKAFGMTVIAWSQNLTADRAAAGAELVAKDELFRQADVVSIHLVLSGRTRGLVGAAELALMKPTARLVNTSRGPIVVEADLLEALRNNKIAGAAVDVFDQEPLPLDHPFRSLPNLLATPHIGYVSRGLYERFYQDTVDNIACHEPGEIELSLADLFTLDSNLKSSNQNRIVDYSSVAQPLEIMKTRACVIEILSCILETPAPSLKS